MLWTEWANDLDGDGWPSEGEYIPRALTPPIDRSTTFGDYTTLIDDTAAFLGRKLLAMFSVKIPLGTRFWMADQIRLMTIYSCIK